MIIFGPHELVPCLTESEQFKVTNLSSYYHGYKRDLAKLVPPLFVHYDDKDFDIKYAEYILGSDCFYDLFMYLVLPAIYCHENVYVLVHRDYDVFDKLTDSLQKFILCRYGVNSFVVSELPDLIDAINNANILETTKEPIHIQNLDNDMIKFSTYLVSITGEGQNEYQ